MSIFYTLHKKDADTSALPSELASENALILSPSSQYMLTLDKDKKHGVAGHYFAVRDALTGSELFTGDLFLRSRDNNFVLWGEYDNIWVYSGDTGVYIWEKEGDTWNKKAYADIKNDVVVPETLRQLRPKYFQ